MTLNVYNCMQNRGLFARSPRNPDLNCIVKYSSKKNIPCKYGLDKICAHYIADNNMILIVGGTNLNKQNEVMGKCWLYDIDNDNYRTLASYPDNIKPRVHCTVFNDNNNDEKRIISFGGTKPAHLLMYNISNNEWNKKYNTKDNIKDIGGDARTVCIDDNIWSVIGGGVTDADGANYEWLLKINKNQISWIKNQISLPMSLCAGGYVLIKNNYESKFILFGGASPNKQIKNMDLSKDWISINKTWIRLNDDKSSWKLISKMPFDICCFGYIVWRNRYILTIGGKQEGYKYNKLFDHCMLFDTHNYKWYVLKKKLPMVLINACCILINDDIHVLGGWNGREYISIHWIINVIDLAGNLIAKLNKKNISKL